MDTRSLRPISDHVPRGPRGNLITGCLGEFRRDILGLLERCAWDYGDFVPIRVASRRGVLISHPGAIEEILVVRNRDFRKVFTLRYNRLFLGDGLLTSEGEHWRRQRRLAQPCFHPARISEYLTVMADEAERAASSWGRGAIRDVQQEMMELTLRIVTRCLFGADLGAEFAGISRSIDTIQACLKRRRDALIPLPDTAPTPGNIPLRLAVHRLDRIVYGFIRQARAGDERRTDLVSLLVRSRTDDQNMMTDRHLRDEVMTMFFAGHETTALALSWSLYLLACHPETVTALHEEVDRVWPTRRGEIPALADLMVTRGVVQEALRLYPPVFAFGRDAIRDTQVAGQRVKSGSSLVIAPWVVHRDPRWFADPLKFRPRRWQDSNDSDRDRFAYFPFGGGARQCIGKSFALAEATIVLATLARNFTPVLTGDATPVELWPTFTLRAKRGLFLKMLRRTGR